MTKSPALFTREMWRLLPEGLRVALIDGTLVREPTPTWRHQLVLTRLLRVLLPLVGPERVVQAPMSVAVDDTNVLQPDLLVIPQDTPPDPEAHEAPTPLLVVEVLSTSTADRDREVKTPLYLRAGVREVWLADILAKTIEIRAGEGTTVFGPGETAASKALPGFAVDPRELLR